jgi:hypothetical protein
LSSSVAVLPPITTDDGEATEDGDEDELLRPFRRSFRRLLPVVDDVLFMDTLFYIGETIRLGPWSRVS